MADLPEQPASWTIYVTNDNCPDYTWGLTEEQTRKAFADIVAAHLDLMKQTDGDAPADRDRYNMAVTQEAFCFLEHYPKRKDELIGRIKEGRLYVSPFLCNSLWGFQDVEGFLRTLYPAARLEREWGIPRAEVAEHIELPSLPSGIATLLVGSGIRWVSVPYYNYDSTFGGLRTPPLFTFEGPDGSRLRVVMDPWTCNKASYTQGAKILANAQEESPSWVKHYAQLGHSYSTRAILASGTHGDISPSSGFQAADFAKKIKDFNARGSRDVRLVNAAVPQFCDTVDKAEEANSFLPTVRGCFGHSWELWPVCLAKYAADMRQGERDLLATEALLVAAGTKDPDVIDATQTDRRRAEWCLVMLSDHAWNGTDDNNRRHNAELRRSWSRELNDINGKLLSQAWKAISAEGPEGGLVVFNPLSFPRSGLVRLALARGEAAPAGAQAVNEDGQEVVYATAGRVSAFGLMEVPGRSGQTAAGRLSASPTALESPEYRLDIDAAAGGVVSLVHKASGRDVVADKGKVLCQTIHFDGKDHPVKDVSCRVVADGPLLARIEISGQAGEIAVRTLVTVYADSDWVDFDVRLTKPASTRQERVCHVFPVLGPGTVLRAETTGAVIRPKTQPNGDLLPGADTRRLAVQGFVDVSSKDKGGITIIPLDAFMLWLDEREVVFEALGNDQNYKEVVHDQNGVKDFRFRYALRFHAGDYDGAEATRFSRQAATPLLAVRGSMSASLLKGFEVDPCRAVATCLKPADVGSRGGTIVRLRETSGRSGPLLIRVPEGRKVLLTDLLERDQKPLAVKEGQVAVDLQAYGFAGIRIAP